MANPTESISLDDLKDVSAGTLEAAREPECPICKIEYESTDEIWKHDRCGMSFHADCLKEWFTRSRSCSFCRQDIGRRPRLRAQLYQGLSPAWVQYWQHREARLEELGLLAYSQQPGYVQQSAFRGTVERLRMQYNEELQFNVDTYFYRMRIEYFDRVTQVRQPTIFEGLLSLTVDDLPDEPQQANFTRVQEAFVAEFQTDQDVEILRQVTAVDNPEEVQRSIVFRNAAITAFDTYSNSLRAARDELERSRAADPWLRRFLWERDPPNP